MSSEIGAPINLTDAGFTDFGFGVAVDARPIQQRAKESPLSTPQIIGHSMTFTGSDLRGLFGLMDADKLKARLNLRWRDHRDPGPWDAPLPRPIALKTNEGNTTKQITMIGHIEPGKTSMDFTITPVPAKPDGHPNYYLPKHWGKR